MHGYTMLTIWCGAVYSKHRHFLHLATSKLGYTRIESQQRRALVIVRGDYSYREHDSLAETDEKTADIEYTAT